MNVGCLQTQFHQLSGGVKLSILEEASAIVNTRDFKHKHFFCNMLKIKTKQEQQSKTILKVTNLNNQSTTYYGTRKWTKNIFNCDYKATNFSSVIL